MPPILVPSSAKRIAAQILVIPKLNGRKKLYFERLKHKDKIVQDYEKSVFVQN